MGGVNLLELMLRRRSVRRYGKRPVKDESVEAVLKAGLAAPSSFGHQAVELVVSRNPETIRRIGACKALGGSQVDGASALVVVMARTEDGSQSEFWIEDAAIASSFMLLMAEEQGLGACWVHIRNRSGRHGTSDEEIRALLGVPDGYTVLNLISLGEKGESKRPRLESDLDFSAVHREMF